MAEASQGWAVIEKSGKINIRTVSDTRRAAIVNWLVSDRNVMVYGDTTDDEIERRWLHYCGEAVAIEVIVTSAA